MASVGSTLFHAPGRGDVSGIEVVQLGYVACNWDSLILASAMVLIMTIAIVVLKITALAEIYAADEIAVPAFYYFGDKRGMRASVQIALIKRRQNNPKHRVAENFQNAAEEKEQHASLTELINTYLAEPLYDVAERMQFGATFIASANSGIMRAHTNARNRATRDAAELGRKISADFGH